LIGFYIKIQQKNCRQEPIILGTFSELNDWALAVIDEFF